MSEATDLALPTGRVATLLARVGIREHVARQLAATPSLRLSWLAAVAFAVLFSFGAAGGGPRATLAFLIVAPLLPVAGVAAAYGSWADPMYELTRAAPVSGIRTLLLRASVVLVSTVLIVGVASLLFPDADRAAASWLLPSLALTLACLALSTFVAPTLAAVVVTTLWIGAVIAVAVRSGDQLGAFRTAGQVVFFLVVVASSGVLAWRRERLEVEGRAQRRRLIDAAETERRRIERNIHDGAQQQIVSIGVKIGVAKALVERDPAKAIELLDMLQAEAREAVEGLRDMTRGTYPPVLADEGLVPALELQARKAPIPVQVSGDAIGRFGKDLEAAVYYCCSEALQNTVKYARASRVAVALRHVGAELGFTVTDDGCGFDTAAAKRGIGTTSMHERIRAVGGSLEIRSAPGSGTTVIGRVPTSWLRA